MRKILLMALISCACLMQAGEYAYLVFTNTQGDHVSLSVNNLTMTISGSELLVTNVDGQSTLVLADLSSMQFSKDGQAQGINNVLDGDKAIDVYTPLGAKVGHYDNLLNAASLLPKGAYVISNGIISQTIVLR